MRVSKQNKMLGSSKNMPKRRNKKEIKVDRLSEGNLQPLHRPKMYHQAPRTKPSSNKKHLQEGKQDADAQTST
jgi:hypothetical protein